MQRKVETVSTTTTTYSTDAGRTLISLMNTEKAMVDAAFVTPDELDELATACLAAAEELRSMAAMEQVH